MRVKILLEAKEFSWLSFSKSLGLKEKKATSEPEIKAEQSSRNKIKKPPRRTSGVKVDVDERKMDKK